MLLTRMPMVNMNMCASKCGLASVFSASIGAESDGNKLRGLGATHSSCLVHAELRVICLEFNVGGNISTLVTGYCKSNRRGF